MTTNRRRAAWGIAGASVALVLVVALVSIVTAAVMATTIRKDQVDNTQTIDNTALTLDILLDCTDPKGECYQRGQASQRRAIDDITIIAAAAAACANQPTNKTVRAVLDCTLRELDAAAE